MPIDVLCLHRWRSRLRQSEVFKTPVIRYDPLGCVDQGCITGTLGSGRAYQQPVRFRRVAGQQPYRKAMLGRRSLHVLVGTVNRLRGAPCANNL